MASLKLQEAGVHLLHTGLCQSVLFHILFQQMRHFINVNRLGHMRIHAAVQTFLDVLRECVSSHGDDRKV